MLVLDREKNLQLSLTRELDPEEELSDKLCGVPTFPVSRPLKLDDKPLFDSMLRQYPPEISELTFTNLFAWRNTYCFKVSTLNGYLLVLSEQEGLITLLDPIGPSEGKDEAIEACFAQVSNQLEVRFIKLPESTAQLFAGRPGYRLAEDRNNSDYVYRSEDLSELKGNKYDGKRNQIKRFKESAAFEYLPLTADDILESLGFEEHWCHIKGCENDEGLSHERDALVEMLINFEELGITGGIIKVNGKIVALTLGERLNSNTLVVHIEKGDSSVPGIYQAVNMLFAQSQRAEFAFVNREQDLGVPGLRQAKESYHPHHMVNKYSLVKS